ncbi:hypothetical protein [Deinococcus wulumuqiensis]|uniref:hypothetical protein n=1 Tax=Deinococcus wulumuqiensis TaxID=980427 RepID=UPI0013C3316E|nr:hypothetical protein [Deinococcus wulumuqiensis]
MKMIIQGAGKSPATTQPTLLNRMVYPHKGDGLPAKTGYFTRAKEMLYPQKGNGLPAHSCSTLRRFAGKSSKNCG